MHICNTTVSFVATLPQTFIIIFRAHFVLHPFGILRTRLLLWNTAASRTSPVFILIIFSYCFSISSGSSSCTFIVHNRTYQVETWIRICRSKDSIIHVLELERGGEVDFFHSVSWLQTMAAICFLIFVRSMSFSVYVCLPRNWRLRITYSIPWNEEVNWWGRTEMGSWRAEVLAIKGRVLYGGVAWVLSNLFWWRRGDFSATTPWRIHRRGWCNLRF